VELWSTTGSEEGTALLMDINTEKDADDKERKRTLGASPANLTLFAGNLYFTADDAVNGVQLWSTTGDKNGTEMVRLIGKGPRGATPTDLTLFNGQLFFSARRR
jgi:ELWxxDGT repeat protein